MSAARSRLLLFLVCIALVVCYWAGTTGGFILDDLGSLEQLGYHNNIDSLEKLKAYVFGGITGPGGRPVALLTFAANAQAWPADPYYFIITNIAIHLVNTVLLYWFLTALFSVVLPTFKHRNNATLLACALWALHPFHVSTVLYIVQRMTLLATTFSLLVFIAYLYARRDFLAGRYIVGIFLLICTALAAALGFFSKEIVVLLPLQLLLIEFLCSVSDGKKRNRILSWIFWGCLVPASVIVVGYPVKMVIANTWHFITEGMELGSHRSFSMFERLLTEQRVLGDYLVDLFLPKMQSAGVFYDDYKISTSFFEPLSTLFWFLLHIGILIGSFCFRRKFPLFFFGVWWFYIGHLMESTAPMLEIKFDHRNYLPSIGLMMLLAYGIFGFKDIPFKNLLSAGFIFVFIVFLYMATSLWGKPLTAAMVWAEKSPNSPRALEHAASLHLKAYGANELVEGLLKKSIQAVPKADAELKFIGVFCKAYNNEAIEWADLAARVEKGDRDWSLYPTLQRILDNYVNGKCLELDLIGYLSVIHAYQKNPAYSKTNSYYLMDDLSIRAALAFDEVDLAKEYAERANERLVPLVFQMNRALFFAGNGDVSYAVKLLERAITIASYSNNETDFTMLNAKEMLQLMRADMIKAIDE